ncbi:hypothetical protein T492DRAFT_987133 [Pavlovales sp. CCMP2436]|nr:hypothetical protein T492DRAFT_987133 [Pavlovales sp. CCMP2436]
MRLVAPLDGYRLVLVISRHVDVDTCAFVESSTCARCGLVGSRRARCALVSSRRALVSRCACLCLRGRRAAACPPGGLYRGQQQARAAAFPPGGVVAKVQLEVTTVRCRVRCTQAQLTSQAVGETRVDMNLHVDAPRHRASAFESSTCWQVLSFAWRQVELKCFNRDYLEKKFPPSKAFSLDAATITI